jgi:nitrile hydratase
MAAAVLTIPGSFRADLEIEPRFKVGDLVTVKDLNPPGHCRVPRYVRGRRGVIARAFGVFLLSDYQDKPGESAPQHLYNVRFLATELWGARANPRDLLHIELWEGHLESP